MDWVRDGRDTRNVPSDQRERGRGFIAAASFFYAVPAAPHPAEAALAPLSPPAYLAPMTPPLAHTTRRKRLPWAELGIEAFAVFLSVLAGFAVTAWLDVRRERALRQTALDQFAQELAANRDLVRDALPYHDELLDSFESIADASERNRSDVDILNVDEAIPGWEGTRQIRFAETARRAADVTGALDALDFETAGRLSDVHLTQDELLAVQRAMIQSGLSPGMLEASNATGALRALVLYFELVVECEEALDTLYAAAIARVEAVGGRANRERDTDGG